MDKKLEKIIVEHKIWLDTAGESGTRANLSCTDLSGVDLSSTDLRYADLSCSDLRGADLSYANLRGADLTDADLSYADLAYANLTLAIAKRVKLVDATLTNALMFDYDNTFHRLKIRVEFAAKKLAGEKPFEIRKNDNFKTGDIVSYQVIDDENLYNVFNQKLFKIVYVTDFEQQDGYIVFCEKEVI